LDPQYDKYKCFQKTKVALSKLSMVVVTKKTEAKYSGYQFSFACSGVVELRVLDPTLHE
jgi:hypothetical protein